MDLSGFQKIRELEKLIDRASDNGNYTIDFVDCDCYSSTQMPWGGTKVCYNSNQKIDGFLAHEIYHADLNRQGFPNPWTFFDECDVDILKEVIGPKSNCEVFNCLSHYIFYPTYIADRFNENEFVVNYSYNLIDSTDFYPFTTFYVTMNKYFNKLFIEKYISIKTDFNKSRTDINNERMTKLKRIHLNLFTRGNYI